MKKTHLFWSSLLAWILSLALAITSPLVSAFAATPEGSETAISAQTTDRVLRTESNGKTATSVRSAKARV